VVLTVNGRKVGDVYRPYGWLDATDFICPGVTNTYEILETLTGEETAEGRSVGAGRWIHFGSPWTGKPMRFVAGEDAVLDDVFANTSYRQKKLTLETIVLAREDIEGDWEMRIDIEDAAGKVVKKLVKTGAGRAASNVTLLLTRELDETDKARHPNADLDKVGFYDDLRPANDPYQFVYW